MSKSIRAQEDANTPGAAVPRPRLASTASAKAAATAAAIADRVEVCFERDAEVFLSDVEFGLDHESHAQATSENYFGASA